MFKRTMIAASLAVAALTSAHAMAAVVGGGATLPENLYNGTSTLPRLLPTDFSYTGVGSGAGKTAFLTNAAASIGQPAGTPVDFAGSDSALTAAELTNYTNANGATFGKLIQVPSVGTAVTIAYKRAGVTTLQLSAAQLCGVFSGDITTWGTLLGTADNTPIKVIYRSGSSGTTELLARFLNDSCPTKFGVSGTFTTANIGVEPATWQAVATSADMVTAVNATDGTIGYVSPDYVNVNSNAVVARVSKAAVAAGTAPLPTLANARTALGTATAPATAADRANPLKWVPTFGSNAAGGDKPVPTAGYPIVGYTNFLVGQCYTTAADAASIRSFFNDLYTGAKAVTIAQHSFVSLPTAFAAEIKKTFLDNGYSDGLDIANVSVCNGLGRP
ncbi:MULTISPECIES: substrate-binding domain-containing protein [unclassified Pseudomonas]|uniref:substrate-binding domain-containing protein n=1 Tax=unclassified Pseudomonas TaxID=196821 RepID=UPI002AC8B29E|nr:MULTISPECIES: substrate-binding domain-containing protein [unclassified Pseudomonas]MEB0048393.1 substrate-binding domain-containing protein [Pseudomonas sp. Dout3]MEB0097551.1 substrate-binding domain-containing protein [Pseudomonas sp. DC1.2]WPX56741.1 substrate-binding domain-containing protein [Pseudomonas sp. DC1.2]